MTASGYVVGVDIGTTSTKAILYDRTASIIARYNVEYPLHTPVPGAAEQDPEQIFQAVVEAISQVAAQRGPESIACVSFSAAMHSLIALDAQGRPLTACITWADARSAPWAERIRRNGGLDVYRRTGTPIHAMSPLAKLCWLRETQPHLFAAAARFVSIKEFVFHRLFKRYVVDHSVASATGLFNLDALDWDQEALGLAGITSKRLSTPVPTTYRIEGLDFDSARRIGLPAGTPFIVGANDGALANIGVNAIQTGSVAVTIGTSGAIRTVTETPVTDPQGRTFCYVVAPGLWVVGGPVNSGGVILRWLRDELCAGEVEAAKRLNIDPYDRLMELAETVGAGAGGLVFHPYLAGERAPLWNADARGSFFGLALHHRKQHLIRAVLEGVIFNLYAVFRILEEVAGKTQRISASGGFARSRLWRQILADVFNQEVVVPQSHDSSSLGAAVLGLYAIGELPSLQAVAGLVGESERQQPIPRNVAQYQRLAPLYLRLPKMFEYAYREIAQFQRTVPYA